MTEVESQPTGSLEPNIESQNSETEKDGLINRLDELLEKYLNTLDDYQKTRQQLSEQLSTGYLSLAQANFQNRSSAVNYGQGCYDERMQAIRKINVMIDQSGNDDERAHFSIFSGTSRDELEKEEDTLKSSNNQKQPTDAPKLNEATISDANPKDNSTQDSHKSSDPLRWFGILVPPALRSAQSTFITAVEGPIPQLATIARELRNQEIEIGRVRKQIKKK